MQSHQKPQEKYPVQQQEYTLTRNTSKQDLDVFWLTQQARGSIDSECTTVPQSKVVTDMKETICEKISQL